MCKNCKCHGAGKSDNDAKVAEAVRQYLADRHREFLAEHLHNLADSDLSSEEIYNELRSCIADVEPDAEEEKDETEVLAENFLSDLDALFHQYGARSTFAGIAIEADGVESYVSNEEIQALL